MMCQVIGLPVPSCTFQAIHRPIPVGGVRRLSELIMQQVPLPYQLLSRFLWSPARPSCCTCQNRHLNCYLPYSTFQRMQLLACAQSLPCANKVIVSPSSSEYTAYKNAVFVVVLLSRRISFPVEFIDREPAGVKLYPPLIHNASTVIASSAVYVKLVALTSWVPPLAPEACRKERERADLKGITASAPSGLYPQFPSASCEKVRPPKSLFS